MKTKTTARFRHDTIFNKILRVADYSNAMFAQCQYMRMNKSNPVVFNEASSMKKQRRLFLPIKRGDRKALNKQTERHPKLKTRPNDTSLF